MSESHVHWAVIGIVGVMIGGLWVVPAFIAWRTLREDARRHG